MIDIITNIIVGIIGEFFGGLILYIVLHKVEKTK